MTSFIHNQSSKNLTKKTRGPFKAMELHGSSRVCDQSCVLCPQAVAHCSPSGSSPWDFPGNNTAVGNHFLPSFLPSLPRHQTHISGVSCIGRGVLYPLNHQGTHLPRTHQVRKITKTDLLLSQGSIWLRGSPSKKPHRVCRPTLQYLLGQRHSPWGPA